jgi:hypothetical protein
MSQKKLLISNPEDGLIDAIRNSEGTASVLYDDTTDTLIATKFSGDGSNITGINADNITNLVAYTQPYDIAVSIDGPCLSGSNLVHFKVPRRLMVTSVQESSPDFEYRLNNQIFLPTSNITASSGDLLSVYAKTALNDPYFTIICTLI